MVERDVAEKVRLIGSERTKGLNVSLGCDKLKRQREMREGLCVLVGIWKAAKGMNSGVVDEVR